MSIQNQTYQNWECLIIDDFSTDQTKEIIDKISENDNRIKYIKNSRTKGAQGARNTGLIHSRGEYIVFFDSDDYMFPNHIEKKIEKFNENPELDIITSFSYLMDDESNIIGTFCWITENNIHKSILARWTYVDTNSAMIRKNVLDDYGYLDEMCTSYQEWDFHIGLSKNAKYGFVPEFLSIYYKRKSGTISSDIKRDVMGRIYILNKYKIDIINLLGLDYYRGYFIELFNESKKNGVDLKQLYNWESLEETILDEHILRTRLQRYINYIIKLRSRF